MAMPMFFALPTATHAKISSRTSPSSPAPEPFSGGAPDSGGAGVNGAADSPSCCCCLVLPAAAKDRVLVVVVVVVVVVVAVVATEWAWPLRSQNEALCAKQQEGVVVVVWPRNSLVLRPSSSCFATVSSSSFFEFDGTGSPTRKSNPSAQTWHV